MKPSSYQMEEKKYRVIFPQQKYHNCNCRKPPSKCCNSIGIESLFWHFKSFQQHYYLPSFDTTVDQRCLPLGFAWKEDQPEHDRLCHRSTCAENSNDIQVLTCGYSFHSNCFEEKCPICAPKLEEHIKKISSTFNSGLLKDEDEELDDDDDDDDDDNEDDDENDEADEKTREYYSLLRSLRTVFLHVYMLSFLKND